MPSHRLLFVTVVLALAHAVGANPVASFQGLGRPSGSNQSSSFAVSDDGSTVAGSSFGAGHAEAFRWTREGGIQSLGEFPISGLANTSGFACSADGSVIVGAADFPATNRQLAFRWTAHSGFVALPFGGDPAASTSLTALADDGSIGGGFVGGQAAIWTVSGGWSLIPGATKGASVGGISADGSVAVGLYNDGRSFHFTRGSGEFTDLGTLPPSDSPANASGFPTTARDVSADGRVVAGDGNEPDEAFRWTASSGLVRLRTADPFVERSSAFGISADGSVIVGSLQRGPIEGDHAMIWDASHGMRRLQAILESDLGLDLGGWELKLAMDVSADGRTIVGNGRNPVGESEAWIATIPAGVTSIPLPAAVGPGMAILLLLLLLGGGGQRVKWLGCRH
jgi:uncharacterized membrane protein